MGYYPDEPPRHKRWDRPPTLLSPYWECLMMGCTESVYTQHTYCVQHKCITFMCQDAKLIGKSIYCDKCYIAEKRREEDQRITGGDDYYFYEKLF